MDTKKRNKSSTDKKAFIALISKIMLGSMLILLLGFVLFALLFIVMYFI